MRTAFVALAVALLASAALTANRNHQLPGQFVGDWCLDNPGSANEPATYRLGRCLADQSNSSDSWLWVHADGFVAHETRCTIVQAAAENSNFLVKFQCSGEGQTWTRNYSMSLQLLMQETNREP